MKTTVNKDGSVTTSIEDEAPAESPKVAEEPKEAEAKVVKAPVKAAPKASATAEKK